jgi:hypothetical protein
MIRAAPLVIAERTSGSITGTGTSPLVAHVHARYEAAKTIGACVLKIGRQGGPDVSAQDGWRAERTRAKDDASASGPPTTSSGEVRIIGVPLPPATKSLGSGSRPSRLDGRACRTWDRFASRRARLP